MLSLLEASNRERARVAAVGTLERPIRTAIRKATTAQLVPLMKRAVAARSASSVLDKIAARGATSFYRDTPGVAFGGAGAATSSGVPGRVLARPLEYGSDGRRYANFETSSPLGTRYYVLRRTTRQFMPDRAGDGPITDAAEDVSEDALEIWGGIVEQALIDALDKGA